jgi:hypothetical protein
MASNVTTTLKITVPEAQDLAARLHARSSSKLATASPEEARDLELAARILWLALDDVDPDHVFELSGGA